MTERKLFTDDGSIWTERENADQEAWNEQSSKMTPEERKEWAFNMAQNSARLLAKHRREELAQQEKEKKKEG